MSNTAAKPHLKFRADNRTIIYVRSARSLSMWKKRYPGGVVEGKETIPVSAPYKTLNRMEAIKRLKVGESYDAGEHDRHLFKSVCETVKKIGDESLKVERVVNSIIVKRLTKKKKHDEQN